MKLSRRRLLTGVAAVALGHRTPVVEAAAFTTADVTAAVELLWNNNVPTLDGCYYILTHVGNYEAVRFFRNA